jgi:hypothetical protein
MGWAGLAVLVVGLLIGFLPTSTGGASCGSAFVASTAAREADFADALAGGDAIADRVNTCEDRRALLRIPAVALIAVGAGLGFAGWHVTTHRPPVRA